MDKTKNKINMERVIKFRGIDENGKWIYGYLYQDETGSYIKESDKSRRYGSGFPVEPKTVGQFTGLLKGKQGKHEIFEGNIYKWGWSVERIGVVKFNTSYAGWGLEYKVGTGTMFRSLTPEFIEEMEYLGNVHEYPHLIK